jgi:linoleoyl-CoA desaturase
MSPANTKLQFASRESPFKRELMERVDAYFASGRSRNATPALWAKVVFWLAMVFAGLVVLTLVPMPGWLGAVLALATGFCVAQVGFNVGHDAIHGSLSKRSWVNAIFARSFDVMGASSRMWAWAHNVVHHTYTNVPGTDHDLEPGFFIHLYRHQTRGYLHRFQHVYAWGLYAMTSLVWVFKKDFAQLIDRGEQTTKADVIDVVVSKVLHLALWVGVPMLVSPWAWWQILIGYVLVLAMTGFTAAVVFQLAHVVEGPAFPKPNEAGTLDDDFVTHQLKTTANFAPRSAVATFFTGGLNHQVEHHLFPRIAHAHYPALSLIVEACAARHGVPYHANPSFFGALASHARTLKACGQGEEAVLVDGLITT